MIRRVFRVLSCLSGVLVITVVTHTIVPVNASTVGFAYLLLVLLIASTWGFAEAAVASIAATLVFNFFFLPPVGTLTIADPQNWAALFSFLFTALIASRLSARAERRAQDAIERQQDIERLYTFSRAILLIDGGDPFAKQLIRNLAEIFDVSAAVLYDRRTGEIHRAGPAEVDGVEQQLRDAAQHGVSLVDTARNRLITAVRLGSEPIASLAMQGARMPDSVLQGIANLVAIGLERARAQDLTHQIEAARQSEQLRTTLIDSMAHDLKTPLTSIRAATTALLANPEQSQESRAELLTVADEEAGRLTDLINDSLEMARLDSAHIELNRKKADLAELVQDVIRSMKRMIEDRSLQVDCTPGMPAVAFDRRLLKIAVKQLFDNSLKYSPAGSPLRIGIQAEGNTAVLRITNQGVEIPPEEQTRIFERFYRSPSVKRQIPGSGLGLSIADSIVRAHGGNVIVTSQPGEITFELTIPVKEEGKGS